MLPYPNIRLEPNQSLQVELMMRQVSALADNKKLREMSMDEVAGLFQELAEIVGGLQKQVYIKSNIIKDCYTAHLSQHLTEQNQE